MTKASQDTKLTVLSDHYKDTQRAIEQNVKIRDRSFFFILLLLVIMAFQFFSPQEAGNVLTQFVSRRLNVDTAIGINYIGSLLWFGLFAIAIRYFQLVINLEKQYNYIHDIEDELAKDYGGTAFTREGKAYLTNYPKFSEWLHIVYRVIFPILFVTAITIKIISEWQLADKVRLPLVLNSAIYILMLISTGLYVYTLSKLQKDSLA